MIPMVGRFLEALGIVVVPIAIVVGLATGSMRQELMVMAAGAAIFWIGHTLAGRDRN